MWATDRETRRQSVNQGLITFDDHHQWMMERLCDSHSHVFIARADFDDIGTMMLDSRPNVLSKSSFYNRGMSRHARVSITVAPIHRGRGYAAPMLTALCTKARALHIRTLEAVVKRENGPSLSAFRSCGFWVSYKQNSLWTLDYRLSGRGYPE
tara:strand:+ start:957 stop:1415 length:459 start_codon:yes stop_codon:yes gene_type:complete